MLAPCPPMSGGSQVRTKSAPTPRWLRSRLPVRSRASAPIGVSCRLCTRLDCEQRAFPPIQADLQMDVNVRCVSAYAPVGS
jgi:hypothetical protein